MGGINQRVTQISSPILNQVRKKLPHELFTPHKQLILSTNSVWMHFQNAMLHGMALSYWLRSLCTKYCSKWVYPLLSFSLLFCFLSVVAGWSRCSRCQYEFSCSVLDCFLYSVCAAVCVCVLLCVSSCISVCVLITCSMLHTWYIIF